MNGWLRDVPCYGMWTDDSSSFPLVDIHVETVDDEYARVTFNRRGHGTDESLSLVVPSNDYASVLIDVHEVGDRVGLNYPLNTWLPRTVSMVCNRDCIRSFTVLDSADGVDYRMLRGLELNKNTSNAGYLPFRTDDDGNGSKMGDDGWVRVLLDTNGLSSGTDSPLFHMEIIFNNDWDEDCCLIGGFIFSEILDALARYHERFGVAVNGIVEEIILMAKLSQPNVPLRVLTEDARESFPTLQTWRTRCKHLRTMHTPVRMCTQRTRVHGRTVSTCPHVCACIQWFTCVLM